MSVFRPLRLVSLTALLLSALLLAACSMVQMGYGQMDRMLAWRLDDYLSLDAARRDALQPALRRVMDWHCSSQLPAYAAWLRAVDADLRAGADAARVDAHIDTLLDFARNAAGEAARELGPVVSAAPAGQIEALNRRFERNNREFVDEWVRPPPDRLERERVRRLTDRIENWTGRLTPLQRTIVAEWARATRSDPQASLDSRRRWQAATATLLARSDLPADEFAQELRALFMHPDRQWTPAYVMVLRDNRALATRSIAALSASLTDAQRRHLQREVASLAGDLETMRCSPTVAGPTPS